MKTKMTNHLIPKKSIFKNTGRFVNLPTTQNQVLSIHKDGNTISEIVVIVSYTEVPKSKLQFWVKTVRMIQHVVTFSIQDLSLKTPHGVFYTQSLNPVQAFDETLEQYLHCL